MSYARPSGWRVPALPTNDQDTLVGCQRLWGYPEVAAHPGISVRAVCGPRSRGTLLGR